MNGINGVDKGNLRVSVVDLRTDTPIENAIVRVVDSETEEVIEELYTNSVGQTAEIVLDAPPIDYSLEADNTTVKPYSEYNLLIYSEDFETLGVGGVQVLPESTAIQNARLSSLIAPNEVGILTIEPHTLWGTFPPKIMEDSVKELPTSDEFVVLPGVVVPEFIIVHLGTPQNTGAQNVWIPFTDYIKNVASSEIYCTWPVETIRANVHAIVSFTLNRVYTEWYRGKGYNFTITNSTAYDQAFDYGRNIFVEISQVVDELFTTYITKPNINQPLFAQYCDGSRVQCPGAMTQWGSMSLGEQGYSAINILKSFYGYDIFLSPATQVEGIPVSYPGSPIRLGDTGSYVRTIQEQLNRISDNFPLIKKVRVDGVFGPSTEESVITFQRIFNLTPDGIVGLATWYALSNIYVGVTRAAELGGTGR